MKISDGGDRTLHAEGLTNGRDLGGLKRADGTFTPRGVFFRSENVDLLTPDGWQSLYNAGIRTVVDLRQERERELDIHERPSGSQLSTSISTAWRTQSSGQVTGIAVWWAQHFTSCRISRRCQNVRAPHFLRS
ncbi:tyrosine-protein phosphatase [Paenarthrobacter nicotinovorans]|uniref:tyrosine-protein phosphatase n=1 Tax=Paenarthrobacter nicotinovorans TaxID=29320 RepID=UPI003A80FFCC